MASNTAVNGGGFSLQDQSELTVSGGAIANNAAQSGGGFYAFNGSSLLASKCEITGNRAIEGGGVNLQHGLLTFEGVFLRGNIVTTSNGTGAGIRLYSTQAVINDSFIVENVASASGGAGYLLEGMKREGGFLVTFWNFNFYFRFCGYTP